MVCQHIIHCLIPKHLEIKSYTLHTHMVSYNGNHWLHTSTINISLLNVGQSLINANHKMQTKSQGKFHGLRHKKSSCVYVAGLSLLLPKHCLIFCSEFPDLLPYCSLTVYLLLHKIFVTLSLTKTKMTKCKQKQNSCKFTCQKCT